VPLRTKNDAQTVRFVACVVTTCVCINRAPATVLFNDNFNSAGDSASWTVNTAPSGGTVASQQDAVFAYDYSTMGIPPAPGSSDTLGLRLRADIPGSAAAPVTSRPTQTTSGLSVSPTGKNFGTNYQVQFYAWSNFFGAANASGLADNATSEGGTNNVMFAVGTSGTVPLVVGNTGLVTNGVMDGVGFATTPDGGITSDFRVYPASGTFVPGTTPGVYAAGASATANQNVNAYYTALFPSVAAPAVQASIATAEYNEGTNFNPMGGMTQAGGFGFAWHKVVITKNNNIITWSVDNTLLATEDASTLTLGGANIALGESDVNNTTARHPSLLFTVFDNLTVNSISNPINGDYNNDNVVNAQDYVVWRKNIGQPAGTLPNDPTGETIGLDQYNIWRAAFGSSSGSGSGLSAGSVPEPASVLLLLGASLCGCLIRRRK
jgi:hypothetical protein